MFKEKVGGAKTDRAKLAKLLRRIEPGDMLIVTRLDRRVRSTRDLLNVIAALADRAGRIFLDNRCRWPITRGLASPLEPNAAL